MVWQGLLISREALSLPRTAYQVRIPAGDCTRYELADAEPVEDWPRWARHHLGEQGEWLELADQGRGVYRAALIRDGRLAAVIFIGTGQGTLARDWLVGLFAEPCLSSQARIALLSGRMPGSPADPGPLVCACMGVGRGAIEAAIDADLHSVEQLSAQTRAGTQCGSCLPELKQILRQHPTRPSCLPR